MRAKAPSKMRTFAIEWIAFICIPSFPDHLGKNYKPLSKRLSAGSTIRIIIIFTTSCQLISIQTDQTREMRLWFWTQGLTRPCLMRRQVLSTLRRIPGIIIQSGNISSKVLRCVECYSHSKGSHCCTLILRAGFFISHRAHRVSEFLSWILERRIQLKQRSLALLGTPEMLTCPGRGWLFVLIFRPCPVKCTAYLTGVKKSGRWKDYLRDLCDLKRLKGAGERLLFGSGLSGK